MGRNAQRRRLMRPLARAVRLGRVELGPGGETRVVVDQSAGGSRFTSVVGGQVVAFEAPGPFAGLVDLVQAIARRGAR